MKPAQPTTLHAFGWGLFAAIVCIGVVDAILLDLLRGYFRSGYNSPALRGFWERSAFAAASIVQDAAILLLMTAPLLVLLGRIQKPVRALASIAIPLGVLLVSDVIFYSIYRVFGEIFAIGAIIELAGGVRGAASEAVSEQPLLLGTIAVCGLALLGALWLASASLRRLGVADFGTPEPGRLAVSALLLLVSSTAILLMTRAELPKIHTGLGWKPSGRIVLGTLYRMTDFDGDGVGWASRPSDRAPFDVARHPWALEVPANGVDENGFAGDLGAVAVAPAQDDRAALAALPLDERPDLLLVFLETFRADLIGAQREGRAITPTLNALAGASAAARSAWTHAPATAIARGALFQGRIGPVPDAETLIDDFAALGYETAYFSAQDDSFRGSRALVGWDRAEHFFDARASTKITSRTRSAASLQVSWKTLLAEVDAFLAKRDAERPLFLYVNIVDTHYPYHHRELDPIFPADWVDRSTIRPEYRERVVATYENAAANVDVAIGRVIDGFEASGGGRRRGVVVTADHGQAFYERGQLGHGQDVDAIQAAVPLIVSGIGGHWPDPIGVSQIRARLLRGAAEPGPARFDPSGAPDVFVYTGPLERPRRIALHALDGSQVWDFAAGKGWIRDRDDEPVAALDAGARDALIRRWEAIRWRESSR